MTADWVPLPYELLAHDQLAHRQRGARHQPRRLRHHVEAARHHRVGVSRRRSESARRAPGAGHAAGAACWRRSGRPTSRWSASWARRRWTGSGAWCGCGRARPPTCACPARTPPAPTPSDGRAAGPRRSCARRSSDLPLGPGRKLAKATLEAAVGRARQVSVDFQSNGGVLLALELPFVDLDPPAQRAPPRRPARSGLTIAVTSMPLEAMPTLLLRKQERHDDGGLPAGRPAQGRDRGPRPARQGRPAAAAGRDRQPARAAAGAHLRALR